MPVSTGSPAFAGDDKKGMRLGARHHMEKTAIFGNKALPYALLLPQLVITLVFFYWPASQAVWQSFLREDAFGLNSDFVGLENYQALFADPGYYKSMLTT